VRTADTSAPRHPSQHALTHRLTLLAVALLGCTPAPELPSLDYRGERVDVGSNVVDRVCAGTLVRLDREVEQIEARLDLPTQESRIGVAIVDGGLVDEVCPADAGGCLFAERVLVDHRLLDLVVAHEIVHARLDVDSIPLFDEGIATAVAPPLCPQPTPRELADLIGARPGIDLITMRGAYYVAGELVAWLLDEFGPDKVIDFMRSTPRGSSTTVIDAEYSEHFGSKLANDYLAHLRPRVELDALPAEHLGCLAPTIDPSTGPVHLVADLDCDSDRVHNFFGIDNGGYAEWTLHIDQPTAFVVVGEVPFGTSLTIEQCRCLAKMWHDKPMRPVPFHKHSTLGPGSYRLRWVGALDEGLALDVTLIPTTP
jgi:hypothetical protein